MEEVSISRWHVSVFAVDKSGSPVKDLVKGSTTQVSFLEKYIGGPVINQYKGSKGWVRSRAQFSYNDYQFFSVQTDVTVQEAGGRNNKQ